MVASSINVAIVNGNRRDAPHLIHLVNSHRLAVFPYTRHVYNGVVLTCKFVCGSPHIYIVAVNDDAFCHRDVVILHKNSLHLAVFP